MYDTAGEVPDRRDLLRGMHEFVSGWTGMTADTTERRRKAGDLRDRRPSFVLCAIRDSNPEPAD